MCTGGNKIEKKNICFVKWFYLSVSIEFLLNPLRVTSLKKKKEVLHTGQVENQHFGDSICTHNTGCGHFLCCRAVGTDCIYFCQLSDCKTSGQVVERRGSQQEQSVCMH